MWKRFLSWLSNLFKSDAQKESDAVGEMRSNNLEPHDLLEDLVDIYRKTNIKYNNLKAVTLAQWMLESGRAKSPLAQNHFNFAGLKWRSEMEGFATKVSYPAHDGTNDYCKFESIEAFIKGYWNFIGRSVYDGWETHADSADGYIQFIVDAGYCPNNGYVENVLGLLEEAKEDLNGAIEVEPAEPDLPVVEEGEVVIYPEGEKLLYYPKAIRLEGISLKTRGRYSGGSPIGSVQHFTSGRSRAKSYGGSRNPLTHRGSGERGIRSADDRNAYCYFLIDRDGNVFQSFPLNRWGYHAGESHWEGVGSSVSRKLVGIEMQNAGKLEDYWEDGSGRRHLCPEGKLAAWFTRPDRGDSFFDIKTECRYSNDNDNIQAGWYHKLSPEQERANIELNIWLRRNFPDAFDLNLCVSHDEVSGEKGIGYSRKNDTGASLSMNMTEFRRKLKITYDARY